MNHTTDLIIGRNSNYKVYVYSTATHALLDKMDCELAFSEITLHWLLKKMHHFALATNLFLPDNLRLILELSTFFLELDQWFLIWG